MKYVWNYSRVSSRCEFDAPPSLAFCCSLLSVPARQYGKFNETEKQDARSGSALVVGGGRLRGRHLSGNTKKIPEPQTSKQYLIPWPMATPSPRVSKNKIASVTFPTLRTDYSWPACLINYSYLSCYDAVSCWNWRIPVHRLTIGFPYPACCDMEYGKKVDD